MKIIRGIVCACCIVLLTMPVSVAEAFPMPAYSVPELVQRSDLICIGVTVQATSQGITKMDTGLTSGNKPYLQAAEAVVADFAVEDVLKGTLTAKKDISILFAKNTPGLKIDVPPFTELVVGEHSLVFLKKGTDDNTFILAAPVSLPPAKILIGKAVLLKNDNADPPFRKVLLLLADSLSDNDKAVQLDCLTRLQSSGFLLNHSLQMFGGSNFSMHMRQDLQEPLQPLLENFIQERILPSVSKMLSSPDADVRTSAVLTAANLQDVAVIPLLVSLIEGQAANPYSEASQALGNYRVKEAVKPLTLLMDSKNASVKRTAAFALREIADPRAIPLFIDHLDDTDIDMREIVISGLFFITNEKGPAAGTSNDQNYTADVLFWKKWASEHQDKLKALRTQLEAADSTNPVP